MKTKINTVCNSELETELASGERLGKWIKKSQKGFFFGPSCLLGLVYGNIPSKFMYVLCNECNNKSSKFFEFILIMCKKEERIFGIYDMPEVRWIEIGYPQT